MQKQADPKHRATCIPEGIAIVEEVRGLDGRDVHGDDVAAVLLEHDVARHVVDVTSVQQEVTVLDGLGNRDILPLFLQPNIKKILEAFMES